MKRQVACSTIVDRIVGCFMKRSIDFLLLLQIVRVAKKGDLVGEIGILCYRPQLFTVRTRSLCQLLRLNRTVFLNLVQSNVGDGTIIINNLLQVYI